MMHQNAKRVEDENQILNFPRKRLVEIIYIPIFILLFIVFELKAKHVFLNNAIDESIQPGIIAILFGLLHILASNILSYLYNLQRIIIPFRVVPLATSRRLKFLGGIITVVGVVISIVAILSHVG